MVEQGGVLADSSPNEQVVVEFCACARTGDNTQINCPLAIIGFLAEHNSSTLTPIATLITQVTIEAAVFPPMFWSYLALAMVIVAVVVKIILILVARKRRKRLLGY